MRKATSVNVAFVGTSSNDTGCPTIFLTERGTLVVQGTTVTDRQALEQISRHGNGIPEHESCVEIPAALIPSSTSTRSPRSCSTTAPAPGSRSTQNPSNGCGNRSTVALRSAYDVG